MLEVQKSVNVEVACRLVLYSSPVFDCLQFFQTIFADDQNPWLARVRENIPEVRLGRDTCKAKPISLSSGVVF